jgi:Cys-tRNA(Pro) deacylase
MSLPSYPITPAIEELTRNDVKFEPHLFEYEEKGGTKVSSRKLGVDEHCVIKTLVFKNEKSDPLIVLMHGDRHVSLKALIKQLGCKKIAPEDPEVAHERTGYLVGGTSPFGLKQKIPIYFEKTILDQPKIFINGGQRGFLVSLSPQDLIRVLHATPVEVAEMKRP